MTKFKLNKMREIKNSEQDNVKQLLNYSDSRFRPAYPFIPSDAIDIIAEVKRSSPTQTLDTSAKAASQAIAYQNGGTAAISVLTDSNFFSGSFEDLRDVCNAVTVPVLCKEFIYFKEQIELAYRYGADMVLLIAQSLTDYELTSLYEYAMERSVVPVVEINRIEELDRVMAINPQIVMVNMRDLNTLVIDCNAGSKVLKQVPKSVIRISASGINTSDDVKKISTDTGVTVFLIGSALMKSGDPSCFVKELSSVL